MIAAITDACSSNETLRRKIRIDLEKSINNISFELKRREYEARKERNQVAYAIKSNKYASPADLMPSLHTIDDLECSCKVLKEKQSQMKRALTDVYLAKSDEAIMNTMTKLAYILNRAYRTPESVLKQQQRLEEATVKKELVQEYLQDTMESKRSKEDSEAAATMLLCQLGFFPEAASTRPIQRVPLAQTQPPPSDNNDGDSDVGMKAEKQTIPP